MPRSLTFLRSISFLAYLFLLGDSTIWVLLEHTPFVWSWAMYLFILLLSVVLPYSLCCILFFILLLKATVFCQTLVLVFTFLFIYLWQTVIAHSFTKRIHELHGEKKKKACKMLTEDTFFKDPHRSFRKPSRRLLAQSTDTSLGPVSPSYSKWWREQHNKAKNSHPVKAYARSLKSKSLWSSKMSESLALERWPALLYSLYLHS